MSPRQCSDVDDTQSAQLTVLHETVNGCRWFGINVEHSLKTVRSVGNVTNTRMSSRQPAALGRIPLPKPDRALQPKSTTLFYTWQLALSAILVARLSKTEA